MHIRAELSSMHLEIVLKAPQTPAEVALFFCVFFHNGIKNLEVAFQSGYGLRIYPMLISEIQLQIVDCQTNFLLPFFH